MTDETDRIAKLLRADVVIRPLERKGPLNTSEMLATRGWFNDRRRMLSSSGGRPTNPEWTLKRQVPLAPRTWDNLKSLARDLSTVDAKMGPGQVAAFLLEDAVAAVRSSGGTAEAATILLDDDVDPRFSAWRQPALFAGRAA